MKPVDMSCAGAMNEFVERLKKDSRTIVTPDRPKTLEEACSFAYTHDETFKRE